MRSELIFKKSKVETDKLLEFGFIQKDKSYIYEKVLFDSLKLIVEYDTCFKERVIDTDLDEEYINYLHAKDGSYASKVAYEVDKTLYDIKAYATVGLNYNFEQSNRLDEYMSAVYGKVDFTFEKHPEIGTYKESGDTKWYALIMAIPFKKIDNNQSDEIIEIINLKVDKKELKSLLLKKGIYPAYHMNKDNWVSIVLNDTLSDMELILMINNSYDLVQKKLNKPFYRRKQY